MKSQLSSPACSLLLALSLEDAGVRCEPIKITPRILGVANTIRDKEALKEAIQELAIAGLLRVSREGLAMTMEGHTYAYESAQQPCR